VSFLACFPLSYRISKCTTHLEMNLSSHSQYNCRNPMKWLRVHADFIKPHCSPCHHQHWQAKDSLVEIILYSLNSISNSFLVSNIYIACIFDMFVHLDRHSILFLVCVTALSCLPVGLCEILLRSPSMVRHYEILSESSPG